MRRMVLICLCSLLIAALTLDAWAFRGGAGGRGGGGGFRGGGGSIAAVGVPVLSVDRAAAEQFVGRWVAG